MIACESTAVVGFGVSILAVIGYCLFAGAVSELMIGFISGLIVSGGIALDAKGW